MEEAALKKRKLEIIEEQRQAALAALSPLPERLRPGSTKEQIETKKAFMAERARLQRKIGRDAAHAKRALGDDRSTEEVAVKKATNAARPKGDDRSAAQVVARKAADATRPKGDDRSAAQVSAQKAADATRPKGDDRSAAQVVAQKTADAARPKGNDRKRKQVLVKNAANAKRFPRKTSGFASKVNFLCVMCCMYRFVASNVCVTGA